jgi:hypothetical protein
VAQTASPSPAPQRKARGSTAAEARIADRAPLLVSPFNRKPVKPFHRSLTGLSSSRNHAPLLKLNCAETLFIA